MNDRRHFFQEATSNLLDGARQALQVKKHVEHELNSVLATAATLGDELAEFDADFFSSYELSYSMTLAYPRDFFEQIADKAGVTHAGVDTLDLVKELHCRGAI
jgi:hypothetical protein